jgi:hypothetical protein
MYMKTGKKCRRRILVRLWLSDSILKRMGDFKSFVIKKFDLAIIQEGTNFPRILYIHLTAEYKCTILFS